MIEQPGGVADRSCQPRSNYFFNDDRKPHPAAFFLLTRRKDETDIAGAPQADFGARVVGTFLKLFSASLVDLIIPVAMRSEEHTSELQSLMRISYAVFCLKKKTNTTLIQPTIVTTTSHDPVTSIH